MPRTLADLAREQQIVASLAHLNSFEHPSESVALLELARGKAVLEIGTFQGYSAILMGKVAKIVHTVDWHRGGHELGEQDTLAAAWRNVREAKADNVILHVGRSLQVLAWLEGPFDLVFIDGSHEYGDVWAEIDVCVSRLQCKTLLFHDYGGYPGVTRAVDELAAKDGWRLTRPTGSLAMVTLDRSIIRS